MIEIGDAISIFSNFQTNIYVLLSAFPVAYSLGFIICSLTVANTGKAGQIIFHCTYLARGTPIVVQLVAVYFGLSAVGFNVNAEVIAVSVFAVHYGAILVEKFRSAFILVGRASFETGFALGMRRSGVLRWIFLPQTLIASIPAASNAIQGMLKDTAILSAISIMDAITTTKSISSMSFDFFWPYIIMYTCFIVSYITITFVLNRLQALLDIRFGRIA